MINMAFMPLYMWEMWDVTPVTHERMDERTVESRAVFSLSWIRKKRNIAQRCAMRWIDCGRVRCSTRSDCKAATVLRRCFEQSNQIHWKRLWCEHLRIAFLKIFFYFTFWPSADIQLGVGGWMSFAVGPPDHFDLLTQLIPRRLYEIKFVIHSFCFIDP